MENVNFNGMSLGDIVTYDYRTAAVFKEAGLDFCCGGKKSLTQACDEKAIDITEVLSKLDIVSAEPADTGKNYNEWDLSFLSDYIVNTHHTYVKKSLPDLLFYTKKIADVHGANHSELLEVGELFKKISTELTQHLKNEEEVLFPAIKEAMKKDSLAARETIFSEITRMSGEHEFAGGAMDKINEITNNYLRPGDACNTYILTLKLLEQFEDDLHIHVHLENNILYPKALKL